MRPPDGPSLRRIADAFAGLRESLDGFDNPADRAVARDAARDALDRDAALEDSDAAGFVGSSFAVEGTLHRGANFEIQTLRHRDLGTRHALKTPLPDRRSDPLLRRLLMREARHQSRVQHPACLAMRVLLRLPDGRPGLLTDFIDAPTLSQSLLQRRFDEADIIALALRLADALGAVHGAGLVHGDLTPANVLLPKANPSAAILIDFGLSREIGAVERSQDLAWAASPGYAPPEAVRGDVPASPSADLYALGRTLAAAMPEGGSIAPLVSKLVHEDPRARPAMVEVRDRLDRCDQNATTGAESRRDPVASGRGRL